MKPYIRYRDTFYPIRELAAEMLCTLVFLFLLGILVGFFTVMLEDFSQSEATLDSLRKTAEE